MAGVDRRLVVVSNRLPVVLERDVDAERSIHKASGGLVSALLSVLGRSGGRGRWIGWLGSADIEDAGAALAGVERELGCRLIEVPLGVEEIDDYYSGAANEVLWPLFHDQLGRCRFEPRYWRAYERVNRKFARIIAEHTGPDELIWVHDYHLIRVAAALRAAGVARRVAFFLHIPFPPIDLFASVPWRQALIDGLLAYALIGVQSERDLDNLLACVAALRDDVTIEGRGRTRRIRKAGGGITTVTVAPISVDYAGLVDAATRPEVEEAAAELRAASPSRQLILGVDRLDYSKGIPERLAAYDRLLANNPELHGRVRLVQVVVPSRTEIAEYRALRREIQRLVGAINGKYWLPDWTPVEFLYRSLEPVQLLGFYRAADVALVTPLKDGMNLICKEYCACCIDDCGVLVLSEFAGAAAQLGRDCLLVNPHDVEQTAAAIRRALMMPIGDRRKRMRALRASIAEADIFAWVEDFFAALPGAPWIHDVAASAGEAVLRE